MTLLGKAGPMHGTGTRQYAASGDRTQAEAGAATGKANGKRVPEPLADWMSSPDRACKDHPTLWWYAPQIDPIELRDAAGRAVLDEEGNAVIIDHITVSTQDDADKAERICGTCPLDLDCAEYGLRHERHGRWGGIRLDGLNVRQVGDRLAAVERERRRRLRKRWSA